MTNGIKLDSTRCAICDTEGNAFELYPANFDFESFNPTVFSARRLPDRVHYRLVRCVKCGLVRSDPVADSELLAQLYRDSTFDYADEADNLKKTYGRYLAKLESYGVKKDALLEIGCGNGFFLEEALAQGYSSVRGVEPSTEAIEAARADIRPHIVCDIMRPGLFDPSQFDVVCIFQALDHIVDPLGLLKACFTVLKPDGFVLCLNHNIEALSARILNERSPIIDIEHTFLYSPDTMNKIFMRCGFEVKNSGVVYNTYSLQYLVRLIPLPHGLRNYLLSLANAGIARRVHLTMPLGNLYLIAQKPPQNQ